MPFCPHNNHLRQVSLRESDWPSHIHIYQLLSHLQHCSMWHSLPVTQLYRCHFPHPWVFQLCLLLFITTYHNYMINMEIYLKYRGLLFSTHTKKQLYSNVMQMSRTVFNLSITLTFSQRVTKIDGLFYFNILTALYFLLSFIDFKIFSAECLQLPRNNKRKPSSCPQEIQVPIHLSAKEKALPIQGEAIALKNSVLERKKFHSSEML